MLNSGVLDQSSSLMNMPSRTVKRVPEVRTIRSLGVEDRGRAYYFSYEEGPPPPNHFRIQTLYTGISAGTELTFLRGTNPYLHSSWDGELGLFCPGEASAHYPVPFLGYMEVGRVVESRTPLVQEGEIVAMAYGHKDGHTANAIQEFYLTLPEDLDPILGIYVAQMGPICANGLLHAAAEWMGSQVRELGDGVRGRNVVVIGAGVVGLLTALFARHHGAAEVVIVNRSGPRVKAASGLRITCLNDSELDVGRYCKERWHHDTQNRGADLVFQCRADSASLQLALRCLRPQGTVYDLAFYQEGASDLLLGHEFHHNGLSIRCVQIARVPVQLAHAWNRQRLALETVDLLRAYGDLVREHMITHVIPFEEGAQLMAELSARYHPEVIQAVLEVSNE